jgi:hypothetical protein
MKLTHLISACVVVAGSLTATAFAQESDVPEATSDVRLANRLAAPDISLADVPPTVEMWLYSQELKRYEDPQTAVRRKAEIQAQQRQQRIAARKAFGISKQRPSVYHTPFRSYFTAWQYYGDVITYPFYSLKVDSPEPTAR